MKLNFRFLTTGPWIAGFAFCLLFAVVCGLLGQWQMDRRMQAVTEINKVLANYDEPAVDFDPQLFGTFRAEQEWTPVQMRGEYLVEDTQIVRNRPLNGRPGYEVLVPFRTTSGDVVVVNRGWLPIGDTPGRPEHVPTPPEGTVDVVARVQAGEPTLDREAPQGQLASIDLVAFEEAVGYPVLDAAYGLRAQESPAAAENPELPPKPPLDEGPHLSYALQWFLFGLMSFIVWGYMARQRAVNDRDDALAGVVDDGRYSAHRTERRRPVHRRRQDGPTDEEVEDAYDDARPVESARR